MNLRYFLALALLSFTLAVTEPGWAKDGSKTLVVGSASNGCTGAGFSRIQDAIDAATEGQQIQVCAGLYPETPVITTPLKLTLMPGALVMPSSVLQSTVSLVSGSPLAGIVTVMNANGVDIEGLVADAGAAGITQCAPNLMGVIYQNASGSIKRSWVRNTLLSTRLNGCQSGNGIFVQSGNGGSSRVTIAENRVDGYQKNGITANEVGTVVEISKNVVVGVGPTTGAAQNGIQIGYGAQGEIEENLVTSNIWSPCVSPDECLYFSTGILVEQSDRITVLGNTVANNLVNIFLNGDHIKVKENHLFGSLVLDSIQVAGVYAEVEGNHIYDSARAAIAVSGDSAKILKNFFVNAPIGILKSGSVSSIDVRGNDYVDVDTRLVDPDPSTTLPGASNPQR
jgi:nitrous oxidase accessory protein NosD